MTELFRYIEQSFVLPTATDSIDVSNESSFQTDLRGALEGGAPPDQLRELANTFLSDTFPSPTTDPFKLGTKLSAFRSAVLGLGTPDAHAIDQLLGQIFGGTARQLIDSDDFLGDMERLDDAMVAIKLATGFDKVNAADLVALLEAAAFIEDIAIGGLGSLDTAAVARLLARPVRIPAEFVSALNPNAPQRQIRGSSKLSARRAPLPAAAAPAPTALTTLQSDHALLQSTYEYIMALAPEDFQLVSAHAPAAALAPAHDLAGRGGGSLTTVDANIAAKEELRLGGAAIAGLGAERQALLTRLGVDPANTPASRVLAAVKRSWITAAQTYLPASVAPPSKVFRVGAHVFAVSNANAPAVPAADTPPPAPDFSHAITRPVGIGNLLVVRQELVGYEAKEISHIENVLEGELLRRSTRREETNELTITQETETTQAEERDHQSTDRNELATETQKESGQQSTSVNDQTTSTDYGKLVENSKTNYARSVTDRAVNSLTQRVKQQRIQREKKTFIDEAVHELDNRAGATKVRGIYQWVDKKYKARIVNLGKRLLYDVVIPEPAAFLIESLKNAVQPENFQLTKPVDPGITPRDLNAGNYSYYASQYGVTGAVTPPPDEFIQTVAYPSPTTEVSGTIQAFGGTWSRIYFSAFVIKVPENYRAISGYIQKTNPHYVNAQPTRIFEFYVGEYNFIRFVASDFLNKSFGMNGETGDIPVTARTFDNLTQFNFAIGINCQRTDKALEVWQLKTHAAIMAGYQRQLADYQDKLAQYMAAVRSQMALAQNYSHDPSIEQQELKRAFIYLLLGEHFAQAYLPTPDPSPLDPGMIPPQVIPPDPAYVRDWGAMVAFFERAFEWENIMYTYYPYFWGRPARWGELILIQDIDPQFEAFLKAGAARVVIPARPGFEAALAHYQETGDIWMGEEIPDMFSDYYVSIIAEIKARNFAPGDEICVAEWDVSLPTTLVMLKEDATLPEWKPSVDCNPPANP